jgi:hypothetical protein
LKVETGPVYNADPPPVEVEASLVDRSWGTTVLAADAHGNIVGRKLDEDADHLREGFGFLEEIDPQREP